MILDKLSFKNLLDDGEEIIYVAHVHPFIIYGTLFRIIFFGFIIPAIGWMLFPPLWQGWAAWIALGVLVLIYRVVEWYMDAWIVTNIAVINHEWNSPFDNSSARIDFGTIDTITSETRGLWGTIFQFGNIRIDNVSAHPVILHNVTQPKKVERIIMESQSKFAKNRTLRDHNQLKDLLTTLLRESQKKG